MWTWPLALSSYLDVAHALATGAYSNGLQSASPCSELPKSRAQLLGASVNTSRRVRSLAFLLVMRARVRSCMCSDSWIILCVCVCTRVYVFWLLNHSLCVCARVCMCSDSWTILSLPRVTVFGVTRQWKALCGTLHSADLWSYLWVERFFFHINIYSSRQL